MTISSGDYQWTISYVRWRQHSHIVSAYQPIISGDNSHINQVRESVICALCASDSVVIIGRGMPKEKRINLKTKILLCIINPPLYNALFPAQYAPISTVMYVAHDNGAMMVSLLHDSMMRDRYTLYIKEYMPNRL